MHPAKIPLYGQHGKGRYMLVDTEDVEKVAGIRWFVSWNGYATNRSRVNGKNTNLRAHRLITGAPKGMDVDHINHDKLDNRKINLRICTRSENLFNKIGVKGYYYSVKRKRWIVDSSKIGVRHKQFKTEAEAIEFVNEGGRISRRGKSGQ